jgi:hypothetical protein
VTSADLDQDGDQDLATASNGANAVAVLLNQGNGTFAPFVPYGVGQAPRPVTNADLDQDGDVDLVAADTDSHMVSVLLNQGNGTFAPHIPYDVGQSPHSVTTADVDQDGDQDLAPANAATFTVSLLLNQGNGTFARHIQYAVGPTPLSVASADLDQDGDLDLVTANADSDSVSVLMNACSGFCSGYASWTSYGSGWPGTNGIPSFTAASAPKLCTTVTLNLASSAGVSTTAVALVGLAETDQPTIYDGHLFVVPSHLFVLPLPAGGLALPGPVPCDDIFCGLSVFLQVLEVDVGASKGVSFTRGLHLVLGS